MRTIEIALYQFNELDDKAKERARDWFRQCDEFNAEYMIEDAKTIGALFGLNIEKIYYSGFSYQGDGACFTGEYSYKPGALQAVKEYAPQDAELHSIVARLQAIQKKHFYKIVASTKHSGHYYHSGCMNVDVEHVDDQYRDIGDAENEITECLRVFADWIYKKLEKEFDFQYSDDQVDQNIIANEYEFTAEGVRA